MAANLTAGYIKMLYYYRIDASERIDVNKTNWSKECITCHSWYFSDKGCKYEPEVCSGCHDTPMMVYELENIAILNIKGVDYN